jgi:competence protein ComEC
MLRIHFLNVGHGDCTIIRHPSGRLTMIDINNSQEFDADTFAEELKEEERKSTNLSVLGSLFNSTPPLPIVGGGLGLLGTTNPLSGTGGLGMRSPGTNLLMGLLAGEMAGPRQGTLSDYIAVQERQKRELTDPIDFVKKTYPNQRLWRFVLTHPDLDHMRGLKRLKEQVGFDNFWDTRHTKPTPNFRGDADREDWQFYQSLRRDGQGTRVHYFTRGDNQFAFGLEAGSDAIELLSPSPEVVATCNSLGKSNDLSLVLRVYHASRSVLLPGDAEDLAWNEMRRIYGARLKSSFLKASHHGRDSGLNTEALKLIDPQITFVSVGRKPDTDASYRYRQITGKRVASTRYYGNIELRLHNDGSMEWFVQHNAPNS